MTIEFSIDGMYTNKWKLHMNRFICFIAIISKMQSFSLNTQLKESRIVT